MSVGTAEPQRGATAWRSEDSLGDLVRNSVSCYSLMHLPGEPARKLLGIFLSPLPISHRVY